MEDQEPFYYIVYPSGDRSRLVVIGLYAAMTYEIADYARASREEFTEREEAESYAKELAEKHGLTFEPTGPEADLLD